MFNGSGASGKSHLVPDGHSLTAVAKGTRSSPGAPKPCRRITTGPGPPPFPSVPPTILVFRPPMEVSRIGHSMSDVQILKQGHQAVERRFDDRLLIQRHECALLMGFDFIDDE